MKPLCLKIAPLPSPDRREAIPKLSVLSKKWHIATIHAINWKIFITCYFIYMYLKARPNCKACSFPIVVSSPPHLTISSSACSESTGTFSFSSFVSSFSCDSSLDCPVPSLLSFVFASFPTFCFPLFSSEPESVSRLSLLSLSLPSRGLPRYLNWTFLLIPEKYPYLNKIDERKAKSIIPSEMIPSAA